MAAKYSNNQLKHQESNKGIYSPYIKKWHWFLATFIAALFVIWVYVNYLTVPLYKITSTIEIPDDKKGDGIMKPTAFSDLNMFQETKTVDNEIEVLRSRDLIYTVLKSLGQDVTYDTKTSAFKSKELYGNDLPVKISLLSTTRQAYLRDIQIQVLSASTFMLYDNGEEIKAAHFGDTVVCPSYTIMVNKGPAFSKGPRRINVKFKNLKALARAYSIGELTITPVIKDSNTILLSLDDAIPERGVDILTSLINLYNEQSMQKKNAMVINTIMFIDKRLKSMEQDLSTTDADIEAYKQQNNVEDASTGAQINLAKSADYNQMLSNSNVQLSSVNSLEVYLKNTKNQFNVVPSTMGLTDPVLNSLITNFNNLQLERNKMLQNADLSNPLVENLSNQISSVKLTIEENLQNLKQGIMIQRGQLQKNYNQYSAIIKSVPALERGLLERNREQSVKSGLYQYLLQKREESALSLSATAPASQMIDRPGYSNKPDYPKTPLLFLCGGLLGLLLPAGLIYARQQFNGRVKDISSVRAIAGARVLGELSHNDVKSPIVIKTGSKSVIAELFRYIRTNIGTLNQEAHNQVILVTSCMKGEGKTFFCLNIGLALAMLRKKVLLIEFDLRKPALLNKMGITQHRGISDFLHGDIDDIMECITPYEEAENLYVLGCGSLPANPSELLHEPRVNEIFEVLKTKFDYLIVDTSPVGHVSDTFILAPFADLSVYLIRYNYTTEEQLDILKDIYENGKLKNLMVVFNDAKKENRPAYAYGGYGYAS